jgi:hypothetical protein
MLPADLSFEEVVDALDRHHTRATYGAVAAYLRQPAATMKKGIVRSPRYSWLVSPGTSQPTGYEPSELHEDLERTKFVLATDAELRRWLHGKAAQSVRNSGARERTAPPAG